MMTRRDAGRFVTVALIAIAPVVLALRQGGFHVRDWGWVALAFAVGAAAQLARGRLITVRSWAGMSMSALVLLTMWAALSIAWVDESRHDAWVETARCVGLVAVFGVSSSVLTSTRWLRRYAVVFGGACGLLALGLLVRMHVSDLPLRAFIAGRLSDPVGYAPATAGLCFLGMFTLLGVSVALDTQWCERGRSLDALASGIACAGASLCASVGVLAQSRGTIPALAAGMVVGMLVLPRRGAWLARLVLVGGAVVVIHSWLAAPYSTQFALRQAPYTRGSNEPALLAAAERAAHSAADASLLAALATAVVASLLVPTAFALRDVLNVPRWPARSVAVVGSVLACVVVLAVAFGSGPAASGRHWLSRQVSGCVHPPTRINDPGSGSSYFANAGTGRCDYYRVAFRAARAHPFTGLGAGNFHGYYIRERATAEQPTVVHSLPLQWLAETGIPGLLLGAAWLAGGVWGAVRFARSGWQRDAAVAGLVSACGYWLAHASIDWMWQIPAVTIPAVCMLGGLASCISARPTRVRLQVAGFVAAGVLLACCAAVLPVTMADERLARARESTLRTTDPRAALRAARDAARFDPTWAQPQITIGVLEARVGNRRAAHDAGVRAAQLEPRNWSVQRDASGLIGLTDRAGGYAAWLRARALNPQLRAQG